MRIIVFDLDDTLYPERDYARSGLLAAGEVARRELAIDRLGELSVELFDAGRRGDVFHEALRMLGYADRSAGIVPMLVDAYRNHRPQLRLFPDVAAALPGLSCLGRLAILSDGYLPPQRLKVQALRLEAICNPVVYTEELGREFWKPSQRGFIAIEATCGVKPAECIYVGDNPKKDFIAPRARGWKTVRIRRSDTEHGAVDAAEGHDADVQLDDFNAFERVLTSL